MADLRAELESVVSPWETATAPAGRSVFWIGATLAFAVVSLVAISAAIYFRSSALSDISETRLEINTPATGNTVSFALSPDGRQIVFVASGDGASRLWLRSLSSTTAQPLAGTEGAVYPFWSPDGRSIGFFAGAKLKRIDISGGAPQILATVVGDWGGSWNADGTILFAPSPYGPLSRIAATGGEATAVTKLDRQTNHRFPFFLPDGRQFLF